MVGLLATGNTAMRMGTATIEAYQGTMIILRTGIRLVPAGLRALFESDFDPGVCLGTNVLRNTNTFSMASPHHEKLIATAREYFQVATRCSQVSASARALARVGAFAHLLHLGSG